jgi:hypothetical protein
VERSACGIVAGQQTALVAEAQSSIGELVDRYRAADEMDPLAGGGQLQNQAFESDGVVVTTAYVGR